MELFSILWLAPECEEHHRASARQSDRAVDGQVSNKKQLAFGLHERARGAAVFLAQKGDEFVDHGVERGGIRKVLPRLPFGERASEEELVEGKTGFGLACVAAFVAASFTPHEARARDSLSAPRSAMFSPISVSRTQFLGVEALHTREVRNTHKLLYEHIMQIRSMPLLSNATIVLSFESNLAFEAQHLLHHLHSMNVQKWVSLAEGAHSELGWLTTHSRKEAMALILREALRTGRVAYSPHFFSLSMTRDEAKRRVSDEMRNFSVIVEPSKTHFGKVRSPSRTARPPSVRVLSPFFPRLARSPARRTRESLAAFRTTS